MSLLTGEPRSANVVAAEETEVLQIRKAALKPIFEANPALMSAMGDIVQERRGALLAQASKLTPAEATEQRNVLRSIKNFFGFN
jgi:CRP-like cAMP-binding protein